MRVGLVRHFPVKVPLPTGWMTCAELLLWRQKYDESDVLPTPVADQTGQWACCYASDLSRAQTTARALWSAEILTRPELREVEFAPFATGHMRLPVRLWRLLIRIAWMTGHTSQRGLRDDFHQRVRTMADQIESQGQDALMVSHAGMMIYLRQELLRRGFSGPKFGVAEHALLYEFRRS